MLISKKKKKYEEAINSENTDKWKYALKQRITKFI